MDNSAMFGFVIGILMGGMLGMIAGWILRKRLQPLIQTRSMGGLWQAWWIGEEDDWEHGHTEAEAIGKLMLRLGISQIEIQAHELKVNGK
jgi:ribose/xylose/arabinose/galactoside ABC-type transport system permease subunit